MSARAKKSNSFNNAVSAGLKNTNRVCESQRPKLSIFMEDLTKVPLKLEKLNLKIADFLPNSTFDLINCVMVV